MGAIAKFFGGLFSSSKLTDTAIDGIRKIGGLDEMNGEQKAKFIIDYLNATKHQSLARRFIALSLTFIYGLFLIVWLVATCLGWGLGIPSPLLLADAVYEFMKEIILNPFNIILSFYFVMNMTQKLGKNT